MKKMKGMKTIHLKGYLVCLVSIFQKFYICFKYLAL